MLPKFCVIPELFAIPVPLMVSARRGLGLIVKALAPELKTIALTSVFAEGARLVVFEEAKVALSAGPLGTVFGVQLRAVFQSPLVGLRFQVALPAEAAAATRKDKDTSRKRDRKESRSFTFIVQPKRGLESKQNHWREGKARTAY